MTNQVIGSTDKEITCGEDVDKVDNDVVVANHDEEPEDKPRNSVAFDENYVNATAHGDVMLSHENMYCNVEAQATLTHNYDEETSDDFVYENTNIDPEYTNTNIR